MAVVATPKGTDRAPAAEAVCDCCGHSELVRADYERNTRGVFSVNEGQVVQKLTHRGWSWVKRTLRCPACEAQRCTIRKGKTSMPKPAETNDNVVQIPSPADDLRQPSREQKRQIIALLTEVYDTKSGRYTGGETDKTVAETIGGGVMFGWVAQIREDLFGPDGGNEEYELLLADVKKHEEAINSLTREIQAYGKMITEGQNALSAVRVQHAELNRRIDALKASIGPRARNV